MRLNEATIAKFYTAFAALDADAMASCYAEDVAFADPVFSLHGRRDAGGMWRMLCAATLAKGHDAWRLEFSDLHADASTGRAHWEAHYRFSATGRPVHNIIDARFTFNPDGLIASHHDHFDFWRWSRQALGAPGLLLGWTPYLRANVRSRAGANLKNFLSNKP
jgi:ketosteroid isomerase-like protein